MYFVYCMYIQHEAVKKEVEEMKIKLGHNTRAMEEHFQKVLLKKDEDIRRLNDDIRGMKPISDRYAVLFAEKKELQLKFDAMAATNHTLQQVLHDVQGEKAATDSRVKELTMVVGQVTADNEALTQQNSQLAQQNEVQIVFDFCCISTWNPSACACTSVHSYVRMYKLDGVNVVLLRY